MSRSKDASGEQIDRVIALVEETSRNLPIVPKDVPASMRMSVAKYWTTLKRLAEE